MRRADELAIATAATQLHAARERERAELLARQAMHAHVAETWVNARGRFKRLLKEAARWGGI